MKKLSLLLVLLLLTLPVHAQNAVRLVSQQPTSGGYTNNIPVVACNLYAKYDASTNGDTQVVALVAGSSIYICGYGIHVGASATNVKLEYGTGTNCATGTTALTPAWVLAISGDKTVMSPFYAGLSVPTGNALCINTSAGNPVQVEVYYAQQYQP